ncbi:MAG TPA: nucleoside hydrolase [Enhygromyxa sp.]|nr:nucleoside hydrolase [Enhygromyxa sp.]
MQRVIFEMETSDPDDFMTLLWLADHPGVDLLAVVVTPGSRDQCQLVRWGLDHCGRPDVPIGALHGPQWWSSTDGQKPRVSGFHYKVYGAQIHEHPLGEVAHGPTLVADRLRDPNATILVGSAPKNIGKAFADHPQLTLARWLQQGGFAGDNLVAAPLEKFRGRLTCPSFNPGGAPRDTLALLDSPRIARRVFVSKNVCHGVVWTRELHDALLENLVAPPRTGLATMIAALDRYLHDKGVGKAMHDIVAAACVLDERVCELAEVEIYREKGEWGARASAGTHTWISIGFDEQRFLATLAGPQ